MKLNHGNQQYDCIIGYSGGKDSTALLDIFVNEYNLNPLAVTVDTGYMTDIAMENMKDTLKKIKIDHIFIKKAIPTFTKLYKFHFLNHQSNEKCLTKVICDYCSDLLHSILVKEAIRKEISFIILGYSPDQIARYFYEIPQNEILNDWIPKFILNVPFTDEDREWFINSNEFKSKKIPRVLLPFHVLKYQEDKIIHRIESRNLIKKGYGDPLKTNCNVVAAALFYDLNRYGGILYALQYAELVRQDPSIRKKWLRTIKMVAPLILEGKFKEKGVNEFFQKIGVTKEEFLKYIKTQLDNDPNKNLILKNLNPVKRRIK
ncbi:MAG: hypothetical protein ACFFAH_17000 [Promethearchaeota archaeon]